MEQSRQPGALCALSSVKTSSVSTGSTSLGTHTQQGFGEQRLPGVRSILSLLWKYGFCQVSWKTKFDDRLVNNKQSSLAELDEHVGFNRLVSRTTFGIEEREQFF
jgi:hypothetical protein